LIRRHDVKGEKQAQRTHGRECMTVAEFSARGFVEGGVRDARRSPA
jgi:hypothetical protein